MKIKCKRNYKIVAGEKSPDSFIFMHQDDQKNDGKWELKKIDNDYCKIVHLASGYVLDAYNKSNDQRAYLNKWNGNDFQLWKIIDNGDKSVRLQQKKTGLVLDENQGKPRLSVWTEDDDQRWSINFFEVSIDVEMIDIQYDSPEEPKDKYRLSVITALSVDNDTDATVEKQIEKSEIKTSTFTWAFTETLAIGITTKLTTNIPLFGGIESERSINFTVEANQEVTHETADQYTISTKVSVPGNSSVIIDGWFDWSDNVAFGFTSINYVKCTALTPDNTKVILTAEEIKAVILDKGFTGKIVESDVNMLTVSITGEFRGAYGMKEQVTVHKAKPLKK